jgi:hypothetical protein
MPIGVGCEAVDLRFFGEPGAWTKMCRRSLRSGWRARLCACARARRWTIQRVLGLLAVAAPYL